MKRKLKLHNKKRRRKQERKCYSDVWRQFMIENKYMGQKPQNGTGLVCSFSPAFEGSIARMTFYVGSLNYQMTVPPNINATCFSTLHVYFSLSKSVEVDIKTHLTVTRTKQVLKATIMHVVCNLLNSDFICLEEQLRHYFN